MASARGRSEWDRTTNLMVWVQALATGEQTNPEKLNPYRAQKIEKTPEQTEAESRRGWRMFDAFFSQGK